MNLTMPALWKGIAANHMELRSKILQIVKDFKNGSFDDMGKDLKRIKLLIKDENQLLAELEKLTNVEMMRDECEQEIKNN